MSEQIFERAIQARYSAIPEKFKQRREALGTQREIASLISAQIGKKLSRSYLKMIEMGERNVKPPLALAIVKVLGCEVADIFQGV